jgi:hypothetical protein
MAKIRATQRLELSNETVDLYPWGGIDAMYASELNVAHRPVFEGYGAYTPRLARLNESFLTGKSAPDKLLFAVRSIDQRFPSMEDGLSWPEILTRYDTIGAQRGYLVMKRRESPKTYEIAPLSEIQLSPETMVELPSVDALWVKIDLPLSTTGRLIQQIYKPAILALVVQLSDGTTHAFRLIPGVASAGFLVSPVIVNTEAFALFQHKPDDTRLDQLRPIAFAISGEAGFREHYDFGKAKLSFSRLNFGK